MCDQFEDLRESKLFLRIGWGVGGVLVVAPGGLLVDAGKGQQRLQGISLVVARPKTGQRGLEGGNLPSSPNIVQGSTHSAARRYRSANPVSVSRQFSSIASAEELLRQPAFLYVTGDCGQSQYFSLT